MNETVSSWTIERVKGCEDWRVKPLDLPIDIFPDERAGVVVAQCSIGQYDD